MMKKRIQRKNILVIVSTPYTFVLYLVSVYMSQCVKFSQHLPKPLVGLLCVLSFLNTYPSHWWVCYVC